MESWKRNLLVCWISSFIITSGTSQIAPVLPLYVEMLGVKDPASIAQWSGLAFGINFISLAIFSPIWGKMADQYGRKPMLLRASLWLAIIMTAMAYAQNVYQLVGLRVLQGAMAGFISATIPLVATQTPKEKLGWALGVLSTGQVSGMLIGPLFGGILAETLGFRSVFLSIGILCLASFLATFFFIREKFTPPKEKTAGWNEVWRLIPQPRMMLAVFATTSMVQLSLMSIQPIVTVYVVKLSHHEAPVALIAGGVFAASGLASILAAPPIGRLADRIGPPKVMLAALIVAGLLFIPQAFVRNVWELGALRFAVGMATAGLLPAINTLVKRSVPQKILGRTFGYNQAAQHMGGFAGAVLGGQAAAVFGIESVFFFTGALLLINALWVYRMVYSRRGAAE